MLYKGWVTFLTEVIVFCTDRHESFAYSEYIELLSLGIWA